MPALCTVVALSIDSGHGGPTALAFLLRVLSANTYRVLDELLSQAQEDPAWYLKGKRWIKTKYPHEYINGGFRQPLRSWRKQKQGDEAWWFVCMGAFTGVVRWLLWGEDTGDEMWTISRKQSEICRKSMAGRGSASTGQEGEGKGGDRCGWRGGSEGKADHSAVMWCGVWALL
jgi:hypothetical protein